jgi:hypothetical protein
MTPFSDYLKIDAINWSSLKLMHTSPLCYHYYQQRPSPDKPAYQLGRAVHAAILEPEHFAGRYTVMHGTQPEDWRNIAAAQVEGKLGELYGVYPGKVRRGKAWEQFEADHGSDPRPILLKKDVDRSVELWERVGDAEIVTADQMDTATILATAVQRHETASLHLSGGTMEQTIEWTDPATNLKCKGRADCITDRIVDLKTAREVEPRRFSYAASDYLYHGQMAFYHDGARLAGLDIDMPPVIIAVQNAPPYDVAVYQVSEDALEAGRRLYQGLLDRLAECLQKDEWPGAVPGVVDLELMAWAAGVEDKDGADALDWG